MRYQITFISGVRVTYNSRPPKFNLKKSTVTFWSDNWSREYDLYEIAEIKEV